MNFRQDTVLLGKFAPTERRRCKKQEAQISDVNQEEATNPEVFKRPGICGLPV